VVSFVPEPVKLLIALPTSHTGMCAAGQAITRIYTRHPEWKVSQYESVGSLLTAGFNRVWAHALNLREKSEITHFLMLHDDVRPRQEDWIDLFFTEMASANAQVLSAIIPIKDMRGLTSTALDTDPWRPMRFTQRFVHESRPVTWTDERLLFNTGCMLIDFSGDWVEEVCFTIRDRIVREKGGWMAYVQPEDWDFSRQCRALGVRVAVTRAVTIDHFGVNYWPSDMVWGDAMDFGNATYMLDKAKEAQPQ
jgi:hypothetical protein